MSEDVSVFALLSGGIAVYIAACLACGGVITKGGWVTRRENPGMYWVGIMIPATVFVMIVLGGSIWLLGNATHAPA